MFSRPLKVAKKVMFRVRMIDKPDTVAEAAPMAHCALEITAVEVIGLVFVPARLSYSSCTVARSESYTMKHELVRVELDDPKSMAEAVRFAGSCESENTNWKVCVAPV